MSEAQPSVRSRVTVEDIAALGVRTDLVTACRLALGASRNTAWQLYHSGQLPFPALRVGRRVLCPTAPILQFLGIEVGVDAA